jgi:hypothetical protein
MPLICKMGRKICVLSTKLHKLDAFHEHWTWIYAKKHINLTYNASVDSELAMCGSWRIDKLCDDCVGGSSSRQKRETNMTVNQWELCWSPAADRSVKFFFDTLSLCRCDGQNFLKLELALFHVKCKVFNQTVISGRFLWKEVICVQVLT